MPPVAAESAASSSKPDTNVRCSGCLGIMFYNRAMWKQRQEPKCMGAPLDLLSSRDTLRDLRELSAHPKKDDFTFVGVGLSVYSSQWIEEGKKLPYVKGYSYFFDDNELMKQIEERMRIKRELQKDKERKGDLQDGSDNGDDDLVEDENRDGLFGFEDGETTDEGHVLVENEVMRGLKMPRGPAVVPASISMVEIRSQAVEKVKYSVNAVYKFWERQLDGFSYRYVDSCRRLTEQMEKQAKSTPQSVMWLVHRVSGKDGGKK